jgi:hypothetical protein
MSNFAKKKLHLIDSNLSVYEKSTWLYTEHEKRVQGDEGRDEHFNALDLISILSNYFN